METKGDEGRRSFLRRGLSAAALLGSVDVAGNLYGETKNPTTRLNGPWVITGKSNGDDETYPGHIGSFAKGLPHDDLGRVFPAAYEVYLKILTAGPEGDFEKIPLNGRVRLSNPKAAYAFQLEGNDPAECICPPAPSIASTEFASEMEELYWQALLRDVPFSAWHENELIATAAAELSRFRDAQFPLAGEKVTPGLLFRGRTAGDATGPYLSQLLWMDVPYGATKIVQRYKVPLAGDDHLTKYDQWLLCQRGFFSSEASPFEPQPKYLRNGRDIGEWVRRDFAYQAYLNAALILLGDPYPKKAFRAPFSSNHPYLESETQTGFTTFGAPYVLDLVARVSNLALKASWYDKWLVHRRVRPEEFAGHLHNHLEKKVVHPLSKDIVSLPVLERIRARFGSYLLPLAYPDGCPTHPAYPAGHAVIAGACVTVLKALFNESHVFPNPVESSTDGNALNPYSGSKLTVGGELNKLASNIAIARDFAGVHWRSDGTTGLAQGEKVAVHFLRDQKSIQPEIFEGFSFTSFSGQRVAI